MAGQDLSAVLFDSPSKGRDLSGELFASGFSADKGKSGQSNWIDETKGGLASAPINMFLGTKQLGGALSPVEQDVLRQNREAERKAPVASIASNAGVMAPAMMIPGATTLAGAGLTGAVTGALQPIEGDQSAGNIAMRKGINGAVGFGLGMGGQWLGNKFGAAALAGKEANAASDASRNSVRDATLAEAQQAGYTVPRSLYNPTFASNRLESIGGKSAIKQQAAASNQDITTSLAKKALGVAEDQPLSVSALEKIRNTASAPYREIASISPQASADLEALKQARNDAQGWFNAYNRSASPADLAQAKSFRDTADQLEQALEQHAASVGRMDLIPALAEARKQIAKTYTVQRALNNATGDVSAPVIGRLFDKGKPLSDGLDTIGKFRAAFPQVSQEGAKVPAAGVSKVEAMMSLLSAGGGAALTGNPMGMAAGVLPFLSHPARAMALSGMMQKAPSYGVGIGDKAMGLLNPELAALLARSAGQYATPMATGLLAQ